MIGCGGVSVVSHWIAAVVIGRSSFLDGVVAAAKVPTAVEGNALLLLLL